MQDASEDQHHRSWQLSGPSWLVGNTSRLVLRDAVMAVLKTQELAGLDLITDGELIGLIPVIRDQRDDRLLRIPHGWDSEALFVSDFDRFRTASGSGLLTAAMVVGKVHEGTLNLPRDYEFVSSLTKGAAEIHMHGPHMLSRLLTNCFYKDLPELAMDIASILRRQVELIEAETVQIDEASIAGFPEDAHGPRKRSITCSRGS
jgi:5-methyltetrahydropteroyltriglutamate--homocysteine methyltransferase